MDVYGSLGAIQTGAGGIQQLDPTTADAVLTFLNKRFVVTDPTPALGKGVFNFWAVTATRLAELGLPTAEATKSAGAYIASLPAGNYALANVGDVANLASIGGGDFRFTVADAANVPVIAGPGSTLAVLSPLAPIETGVTEPTKAKAKFSIVTPILGAGIGLLVGGPVGLAVGAAVGAAVEAVRTAA
jgi:hypothetical protein